MKNQFDFLKKLASEEKLSHAMIFCGGSSLDKKKKAIEFVQFLNCSEKNILRKPCGICENCSKIEKGVYADFFLVEPLESGEIQIFQIRDLIWRISLKSYTECFKLAVINKAEKMNQEAQNCLLKVLEEPKGKTIIILITDFPETLLPTILSRAQKVRFFSEVETEIEGYQNISEDFLKLLKSNLPSRFKFAKKVSEDEEKGRILEILNVWIFYLRKIMRGKLNGIEADKGLESYNLQRVAKIISSVQATLYLLSGTNINNKLALETLFLEI